MRAYNRVRETGPECNSTISMDWEVLKRRTLEECSGWCLLRRGLYSMGVHCVVVVCASAAVGCILVGSVL